jgi:Cys-tRNA(Pro)/Cys-tRNA(Cys) deacylase
MATPSTPALRLLAGSGVAHRIHTYELPERHGRDRDDRRHYGEEAAAALGVPPERVFKTLVVDVDGRLVLAIVPAARDLDLRALAQAAGGRRAALADPVDAERASGSVVGGISPLAPRRPMAAVLDAGAAANDTVLVSAGRRGLQVELAPDDLARLTGATVAAIARGP